MPGKIVQARAQVRITLRSLPRLSVSIFACSLASIYGPFFDDLTIMILRDLSGSTPVSGHRYLDRPRFAGRRRTIIESVRLLLRVRWKAGLPHLVLGWPPIGALPSPPPCGWSRGFITEPRTVGRLPIQRLRPALPISIFSCSTLPIWP